MDTPVGDNLERRKLTLFSFTKNLRILRSMREEEGEWAGVLPGTDGLTEDLGISLV